MKHNNQKSEIIKLYTVLFETYYWRNLWANCNIWQKYCVACSFLKIFMFCVINLKTNNRYRKRRCIVLCMFNNIQCHCIIIYYFTNNSFTGCCNFTFFMSHSLWNLYIDSLDNINEQFILLIISLKDLCLYIQHLWPLSNSV